MTLDLRADRGPGRRPPQARPVFFVGAGHWDDEAVMAELRDHVREELGDERAVLVVDASTFPKTGGDSCGVARQWCDRLGKEENCQRGIFLAYAAPGGYAPLDRRLYLPKSWAADRARRARCHVPDGVEFQAGWRIAADLLKRSREGLPHGRVVGDDGFGRPAHFRAWLRREHERYVLDVSSDTVARDLQRRRQVPYLRVDAWAAAQPPSRRARLTVRDGERGPLRVDAMAVRVRTKLDRRNGPEERLVVMRTVEAEPETHYALSNAGPEVSLEELVRVRFTRHKAEEVFEAAKQEAGLAHYEVRSWVGWNHHS